MAQDYSIRFTGDSSQLQKTLNDTKEKFKKITESSASLSRKIGMIKKEMEKMAAAGIDATDEGKEMWQKLADAAKQYDEMLKKIQADTRSVGSVSQSVGSDNEVSGTFKNIDIKSVGAGLLDKAGLSGVSSALGDIGALLNPTTAGVVALGGAVIGAGKALYDYNVELDRSLKRTEQFTGLSGNALNSLRNGIKSVADTFGKDYDTVLSAVDGMMSQFGMDGETALNLIRDGFVSGADDGGKLLDLIGKYSGSFKDAGISASELVAIIGNTRSGIFNEDGMVLIQKSAQNIRMMSDSTAKALDSIGISSDEMMKKLADGSLSTINAMKQISNKLKELNPQSQEVGDVLKNVFGKQGSAAGLELVTALADVEDNLDIVKTQAGEWGEAMLKVQEADRNLENALQSLFGVSNAGWAEMSNIIKGEIYQCLAVVINYFIELYNESTVLRAGIAEIGFVFKTAWEIVKAILAQFASAIKGLSQMIEGLFNLDWDKIANGWETGVKGLFDNVSNLVKNTVKNAKDAVNQTINGKIEVVETVEGAGEVKDNRVSNSKSPINNKAVDKSKSGKSGKSTKTEKIDYLVSIDDNSLDVAEKKLQAWTAKKKSLNIDDKESLEKCDAEIEKWTDEVKKRKLIIDNLSIEPGSKADLEAQIKKLEETKKILYQTNVDSATVKQVEDEIKSLKDKLEKEDIRLGIKPEVIPGSLNDIKDKIKKTEEELSLLLNTDVSAESISEVQSKLKQLREQEKNKEIELNIRENTATISKKEESFKRGSVEDKRQSLSNAQSMISEIQENYRLQLIGKDEVTSQLSEINAQLESLGLKAITLTFNDDGSLTTAAEDLERYKNQMNEVSSIVGSVGNVFGSLGSAVEGSAGEILNFAGASINAIAQIIPQIVTMITAKQAEAMASGTASASALPFPANIAAIASIIATIASVFASLPKFESGGIVGGSSFTGDKLLARVNSGEMILNKKQQANLYNSMTSAEIGMPMQNTLKGDVKFEISGSSLHGALKNYTTKMSKIK